MTGRSANTDWTKPLCGQSVQKKTNIVVHLLCYKIGPTKEGLTSQKVTLPEYIALVR